MTLINISTIAHFALYKKHVLQYYSILFHAMRVTHLKVSSLYCLQAIIDELKILASNSCSALLYSQVITEER